jgi:glyoxylase-like metal-dependent hydrolase (beta-lactamase superfamily II)
MSAHSYSFTVGEITCVALLDGSSLLGKDGILRRFPDATEAECRQAYADVGQSLDEATTYFNVLAARIGDQTILVDAGEGGKPKGGHLPDSLRLAGIQPEAVTMVVITHAHGDHVLGLLTDDHQPIFPNATYTMSQQEMAFWQARIEAGTADHGSIVAMLERQGLRLFDKTEEILPELTAIPIPGHTPGQVAVLIESGNQRLVHMADLLHTPMQFAHPEWSPTFDADVSQSVTTRRAALGFASDEDILTMFYHLPFPGLGRVKRAQRGFIWEPLAIAR